MKMQDMHTYWVTASGRTGCDGVPDARFPYWSFTKTVTALCVLQLVEDGKLDLDTCYAGHSFPLRHLLNHTSGLPDYGPLPAYQAAVAANQEPWPRDQMLGAALANGRLFAPGGGWSYSNIGYMYLKELLEQTTGNTLGAVIADRLTGPRGLTSIRLAQSRAEFAALYWPDAAAYDPRWVYHGCLTGTASDAAHLLHALMTGDLLAPQTLSLMQDTHPVGGPIPGRPWTRCDYGLGLMSGVVKDAGRAMGHSGAGPFCVNAVYHFPDLADPVTVACFTDGANEGVAEWAAANTAMSL